VKRVIAYIGLGANLDEPVAQVHAAFAELANLADSHLLSCSPLYASAPQGYTRQPDFINAVAKLDTALNPHALLDALLEIEQRHGRVREFRNAPRTLDLDLLLYGELRLEDPRLSLPHPRLHERAFVLRPLLDLDPELTLPDLGPARDHLLRAAHQAILPWFPESATDPS
jgi:2-amino-4-hydroxy-6-hydroxymethyldihydropteridine diphosphokinase